MNKSKSFLGLFMAFAMLSCSQDEFQSFEYFDNQIKAVISDAATRTSLGDGGKVLWLSGDDISLIFSSGYHHRYIVSGEVNSSSTNFSPDRSTDEIEIGKELTSHYAVYPYNGAYSISDDANVITLDVSDWANQIYAMDSFEDDKAIMTAKSSTTDLSFSNAFSLLQIQLNSEVSGSYSISSISATSASHAINGKATIDMSQDKPQLVCTGTEDVNKTNTLNLSAPVVLTQAPKNFYLLIPAGTYEAEDLSISVKGKNVMSGENLDWSVTLQTTVECLRSKQTTLTKTFEAVEFSGSTENGNQ